MTDEQYKSLTDQLATLHKNQQIIINNLRILEANLNIEIGETHNDVDAALSNGQLLLQQQDIHTKELALIRQALSK